MKPRFGDADVERLASMYDDEATAYRDHWAPVLHPMACALIEKLPGMDAARVLDVGTGVGTLLPVLRKKFTDATVFGVDRAEGMLAHVDSDAPVAAADATKLCLQSSTIDIAVMAFVLFHLPTPRDGLVEVRRVLRPGGVVSTCTWAGETESVPIAIWDEELDTLGATSQETLKRLAQHELVDTPDKMRALFGEAGLEMYDVSVRDCSYTQSKNEFLRLKTGVGSSKARFESLTDEGRERFLTKMDERLSTLSKDDFTMKLQLVFAFGRRPA